MRYEDIDWYDLNKYKHLLDLEGEVWKPCDLINNFLDNGNVYWVSSYGRCKHVGKFDKRGKLLPPKVFQITDNGNGYKKVALRIDSQAKNFYVHRLVASVFIPNPKNLPQVNHKPSGLGKFDNRVEHLEWSSESHNIKDAHKNGQMKNRSELQRTTLHSDEFIRKMYLRYLETRKVGETAREFGVSRTTLSSIVNKRSRRSVTDPLDLENNPKDT